MIIPNRPELSPEEKRMPLAKYYNLPLHTIGPLQQQIINAGPMNPKYAIKAENWLDHLKMPGEYNKMTYGYCLMEDGSGYIASYSVYQNARPEMISWFFRWINIPCKSQPEGTGNLKYKIWCPPDHFTHGFINGKDRSNGIFSIESLDLGKGGPKGYCLRTHLSLKDFGLTDVREKELVGAGVWIDPALETFYTVDEPHRPLPGAHLCLTMSRPHPLGGMEKVTAEWVGYGIKDGKIYFHKDTPSYKLTEDWLKSVLVHTTTEAQQLGKFLPELYAEYHEKPEDAD